MGTPKALLRDTAETPQTLRTARALRGVGCREILVVLGAAADDAGRLLADHVTPDDAVLRVVAHGWEEGMGASLRAGLEELSRRPGDAAGVLVTLVDLPDVGPAVYRRVAEEWRTAGGRADALLRATYAGTPGHPVLVGRDHWQPLVAELSGDTGAQRYLARHTVREVSCEDLATGRDTDRPEDLVGTPAGDEDRR
jgi:CTP:molybdopterin cytidylyltransferase MocA